MRNFMVLATAFLMLSCAQQEEGQKFIGIQLWSVGDNMKEDPESTLQALGEMGYGFVEAAGYGEGKFYGMEPLAFKELVESNGMEFLGSHTGQDIPAEGSLDEVLAWWEQALDAHKEAGVKYVVQPSMGRIGHESLEGLKRYCDYFNQVGQMANERGLRFGFHNHANEFKELEGETIYDFMLENTDP
jgi:sugar phosphate isomerase/epimerase